ncbi:MAG: thioredoxin family protein [Candidatus Geothermarchaeales archaeon]
MAELLDVEAGGWESEVLDAEGPVLVDFWHEHCSWCRVLDPVLREVAGEFSEQLKFVRLNVLASDENNHVSHQYGVMGTPTLILFCNGRAVQSLVGFRPKEKLRSEIQGMIETYEDCFKQSTPLES